MAKTINNEEPTNEERANRIVGVMHEYCQTLEGREFDDDESDITDMLVDLMHFCGQKGFNFSDLLKMAEMHHEAEVEPAVSSERDNIPLNTDNADLLAAAKQAMDECVDLIETDAGRALENAIAKEEIRHTIESHKQPIITTLDYRISKHPICYVYFPDGRQYDKLIGRLDCDASGEGHLIMSAAYFKEQVESMEQISDPEYDADLLTMLGGILKSLAATGFDGDIWFYTTETDWERHP